VVGLRVVGGFERVDSVEDEILDVVADALGVGERRTGVIDRGLGTYA
jgi:hypothetical protein